IFERWLADVQASVALESGLRPADPGFLQAVEARVLEVASGMQDLVHGFDFATVLAAYWRGHALGDEVLKNAALRWLRGEYALKSEARAALGVRVIVTDDTWYDHLKLLAAFVKAVGYKGLVVMLDEAVNLHKITHGPSREANFEKLLTIFNDTLSGRAANLGIVLGGTPQFLDDPRRGLASYEALRTRLSETRFARDGLRDLSGPVLRLDPLGSEELFVLLQRIAVVHAAQAARPVALSSEQLLAFLQEEANRLGAAALQTPREVTRDFVGVLNLLSENPGETLHSILGTLPPPAPENGEDEDLGGFADFTL
ncbi:MAG TPA: BREX system ATP-binding domain-containing protein, partial [Deinococcales bacterium]|nr:BREX system ATP-binding domain-containing protein [Deinococcales bacterium]